MKVVVLYTKNTHRGLELMVKSSWDSNDKPTPKDIMQNYAIVYEGDMSAPSAQLVFSMFNGAVPGIENPLENKDSQKILKSLGVGHTSMSVGDIVQVGGIAYLCRPSGWDALVWTPQKNMPSRK